MPETDLLERVFPGDFELGSYPELAGYREMSPDLHPLTVMRWVKELEPATYWSILELKDFGDDVYGLAHWLTKLVCGYHQRDPQRLSEHSLVIVLDTIEQAKKYLEFIIDASHMPVFGEDEQGNLACDLIPLNGNMHGHAEHALAAIDTLGIVAVQPDLWTDEDWEDLKQTMTDHAEAVIIDE